MSQQPEEQPAWPQHPHPLPRPTLVPARACACSAVRTRPQPRPQRVEFAQSAVINRGPWTACAPRWDNPIEPADLAAVGAGLRIEFAWLHRSGVETDPDFDDARLHVTLARAEITRRLARGGCPSDSPPIRTTACVVILHEHPPGFSAEGPHGRLVEVATTVVDRGDDLDAASEACRLTNSITQPWFEAASSRLHPAPASNQGCRSTAVGDALLVLRPGTAATALSVRNCGFAEADLATTLRRVQA